MGVCDTSANKLRETVGAPRSLFDASILRPAMIDAVKKLDPRKMLRNPVMFVVEVGTILVTLLYLASFARGTAIDSKLIVQLILWLWFTVLFANFAESVAE
jgi:potassium-transporting ATPase ATP-binding subunit